MNLGEMLIVTIFQDVFYTGISEGQESSSIILRNQEK